MTTLPSQAQPRKPYEPPRLVCYGNLRTLTRAGYVGPTEGASGHTDKRPSERQMKTDLVRIGTHPLGFGLYRFRYLPHLAAAWGGDLQIGAMADEVEAIAPWAVSWHPEGYRVLDYAALGFPSSLPKPWISRLPRS